MPIDRATKTTLMGREWLSAYLFVAGQRDGMYGEPADAAVLEVVRPFIAQCHEHRWIDRHFFIRYRENGAHLRLRLRGERETLRTRVQPALIQHVRALSPYADIEGDNGARVASGEIQRLVGIVRWVPYEPEVERYGGSEAIEIAEAMFCRSSEAAFEILEQVRLKARGVRLGKGMLAMLATVHGYVTEIEKAIEFFDAYHRGYVESATQWDPAVGRELTTSFQEGIQRQSAAIEDYVTTAWHRLQEQTSINAAVDAMTTASHANFAALRALPRFAARNPTGSAEHIGRVLRSICASQVHMTNNRIGIARTEESYLAQACAAGLRATRVG